MTKDQRDALDLLLRAAPLDLAAPLRVLRPLFEEVMAMTPRAKGASFRAVTPGGVPAVRVDLDKPGTAGAEVILYFHGGAFVAGSAQSSLGLASELSYRAGIPVVSVDYRLAPEYPFPAALDDALAAYEGLLGAGVEPDEVALFGESAGGNLVASMLLLIKEKGLPMPASAVLVSPWTDLQLAGRSISTKAAADPSLSADALRSRAAEYLAGSPVSHPLASPILGDLSGLPPLLIQAGSSEILLDDALGFGAAAAAQDVDVTIQITAGVPHVFPAFFGLLEEGARALDEIGRFFQRTLGQ